MTVAYLATVTLPYLIAFAVLIAFLACITIGLGMGFILIFMQSSMSAMKKFNANMEATQAGFEKLQLGVQQQLLSQVRAAETWRRDRTAQLEEEDKATGERQPPSWRQDWKTSA